MSRPPPRSPLFPSATLFRSGSHFNVPYRLEQYLPLDQIKTVNIGGFGARLTALLDGEVEAASLLDPQISMADQLGLRQDRKSTRLNSSHANISYAVFCLKKK